MKVLLLAGTPEAVQIGRALSRDQTVAGIASTARGTRAPIPHGIPLRVGGWGGETAFEAWLIEEKIGCILDATHPFAVNISARSSRVAERLGLDYMQFLRPAWTPAEGDTWTFLNDETDAADHIPPDANVLLLTGQHRLNAFSPMNGRTVWVRLQEPNGIRFPFAHGGFQHRPVAIPVPNEIASMRALGIDWVIARNTGGGDEMPTIEAARRLSLPVGMIRRPPQPEGPRIQTVSEALAWVRRRL
ncbi:MAG: precorrin-6A/cobalt-precorrin-6A reductase [Pseudomonadota bacterium]